MKLLFVRHGLATPKKKNQTIAQDYFRRLTSEGIRQTKNQAKIHRDLLLTMDAFFTSPLLRAVETALLIHPEKTTPLELMASLDKIAGPESFIHDIKKFSPKRNYCFVGHEPHLHQCLKYLLQDPALNFELVKSGMMLLEGEAFDSLKMSALFQVQS